MLWTGSFNNAFARYRGRTNTGSHTKGREIARVSLLVCSRSQPDDGSYEQHAAAQCSHDKCLARLAALSLSLRPHGWTTVNAPSTASGNGAAPDRVCVRSSHARMIELASQSSPRHVDVHAHRVGSCWMRSDRIGPGRAGPARSLAFGLRSSALVRRGDCRLAIAVAEQQSIGTRNQDEEGQTQRLRLAWIAAFSRRNQSGIGGAAFRSAGRLSTSTHRSLCIHKFVCASSADPPLLPLSSPSPLTAMATTAAVDKEIEHLVEFVKVLGQ